MPFLNLIVCFVCALLKDFLFNVSHALKLLSQGDHKDACDLPENQDLSSALSAAQNEVFEALCGRIRINFFTYFFSADSIDTQRAMLAIRKLINAYNQVDCVAPLGTSSAHLVARAYQSYALAAFVLRLLCVFGASDRTALSDAWPDFGQSVTGSPNSNDSVWPVPLEKVIKETAVGALWVSMDAPKKEVLTTAFHGAAVACQMFAKEVRDVASNGQLSCSINWEKNQTNLISF